jgi:hypothetical protein
VFYVGHLSFEGPEPVFKAEDREHGWFTLLAEAEAADASPIYSWCGVPRLPPSVAYW